jgi:LPS-assembly lipoprotein
MPLQTLLSCACKEPAPAPHAGLTRRALLGQACNGALLTALVPLTASLTGCGFALRQPPQFAFKSLYTGVPETSPFGIELRRNLASIGNVQVITDATLQKNADVILDILQEQRIKTVVGINAAGQVREFQLRIVLRFRLRSQQGKELIASTELTQQRDISFNESAVLSKEVEEALLYRNMQTDLVQQILRRLAAVKEL